MALSSPATVDELGIQSCLHLLALLTGQKSRLPIAPTKRMAMVAMSALQDRGIIETPWPEARWELRLDALITPIEGLQWRLVWDVYDPNLLTIALEDYLDTFERDDFSTAVQLKLWTSLASAEAERFFENQLAKHRFPVEWAQDMAFAYRESKVVLTIAQWRYCAWAAVRRGASLALQQGSQGEGVREIIYKELCRRAASVATGAWTGCSFAPYNLLPESALARAFVQDLTKLGTSYWTLCPSEEAILPRGRIQFATE